MKITSTLKPGDKPTTEQLKQINHAAGMPVIPDEIARIILKSSWPIYTPRRESEMSSLRC
ncbi:MAG: hypothetical protein LBK64_04765 [Spirochaetaceae bacterium]|jgi:hypothetical protein|nr:hypothetical protein [Spirochaetaceae bacterium]